MSNTIISISICLHFNHSMYYFYSILVLCFLQHERIITRNNSGSLYVSAVFRSSSERGAWWLSGWGRGGRRRERGGRCGSGDGWGVRGSWTPSGRTAAGGTTRWRVWRQSLQHTATTLLDGMLREDRDISRYFTRSDPTVAVKIIPGQPTNQSILSFSGFSCDLSYYVKAPVENTSRFIFVPVADNGILTVHLVGST